MMHVTDLMTCYIIYYETIKRIEKRSMFVIPQFFQLFLSSEEKIMIIDKLTVVSNLMLANIDD